MVFEAEARRGIRSSGMRQYDCLPVRVARATAIDKRQLITLRFFSPYRRQASSLQFISFSIRALGTIWWHSLSPMSQWYFPTHMATHQSLEEQETNRIIPVGTSDPLWRRSVIVWNTGPLLRTPVYLFPFGRCHHDRLVSPFTWYPSILLSAVVLVRRFSHLITNIWY